MQRLVLSMALLCCLHFSPSSQFRKFERDNSLDHMSCVPDDVLFSEEYGDVKCAATCLLYTSNCTSFFWNPSYKTCYGCRNTYTSTSGLPSDTGSRYFFKYSKYGEGATDDWQCTGQNQESVEVDGEKTCRCSPGFPFDPSTGECVTDCAVWGDTYQKYPFKNLQGTKIKKQWGPKHMDLGQSCRKACTESIELCRSIDHTLMWGGWCTLNEDTAATAALNYDIDNFHYQRNCA